MNAIQNNKQAVENCAAYVDFLYDEITPVGLSPAALKASLSVFMMNALESDGNGVFSVNIPQDYAKLAKPHQMLGK